MRFQPGDYVRMKEGTWLSEAVCKVKDRKTIRDYALSTTSKHGKQVKFCAFESELEQATEEEYIAYKRAQCPIRKEIVEICLRKREMPDYATLDAVNWELSSTQKPWEVEEGKKSRITFKCTTGTGYALAYVFRVNGLIKDIAVRSYDN